MFRFILPFVLAGSAMLAVAVRPPALAMGPQPTPAPPVQQTHQPVSEDLRNDRELMLQAAVEERAAAPEIASAAQQSPAIQDIIKEAFQPLGDQSVDWAEKIAFCESTYDPKAVNASSGAQGLFQFLPSTWQGTPFASASPFDPRANAQAAAWLLQTYGASQWECQA